MAKYKSKYSNIKFGGIDKKDYPKFTDAFIKSAKYNGIKMTEIELEELNNDSDFVYSLLIEYLY